ncbi:hypothetical protein MKX03_016625, partial [Papaver bracteatum]
EIHSTCENSTRKKKGSSTQAGAIPREVMSFSSHIPFFSTSMTPSNIGLRFRMTTPLKFVREHLLAEVTNTDGVVDVLLQNEEGLRWEVVVRPNGIDRYAFFKGWKNLATDNKLKIGDCVIFELIDRLPESNNFVSAVAVNSKDNSFSSLLLSFWISIKPSNMFGINIPVKFATEHLPTKYGEERMECVLLQNVDGRSWEVCARLDGCEKYYLGGKGWKTFSMDNKLNFGDSVLFELIRRLPNATFVMNFHISRILVFVG